MRFATPEALFLLLVVPAIAAVWSARRARGAAIVVPGTGHLPATSSTFRVRLYPVLLVLRCLALALLVAALARPQGGGTPVVNPVDAVDVFVVLDVSSSMASEDFQPLNRLEVAKRVISAFVDGRPGDRVGLIAFARFSVLKCPLTVDHELLELQLASTRMASGDDDGTAIGMALASSVRHLQRSPARSRVVVLLTDGENNRSTIDPSTGAELARAMGVTVYAIGVGRVPVAAPGEGSQPSDRPRAGFNVASLEQLASATGGRYFRADDVTTLQSVFRTIDALERSPVPAPSYLWRKELFWIPASLALAAAALELLLRHTLLRRLP
jgi:Ca-activated chloride channel family protein